MNIQFTEVELVEIVTNIINVNGTEEEIDSWLNTFTKSVSHPNPSDLIFYPDRVKGVDFSEELTPTAIVKIALNYQQRLIFFFRRKLGVADSGYDKLDYALYTH